jgi:hypothetical protein
LAVTCAVLFALAGVTSSASGDVRSIDGSNNNAMNSNWGAAGSQLLRISPVNYPGDGSGATILSSPARPNPREISNAIFPQITSLTNARGMTNGVWQWGQFVDHDLDLTGTNPAETMMIMSPGDPHGVTMIPFERSVIDPATGTSGANPRQHSNSLTSYLDGSMVYGSDATRATALRTGIDGKLKMSGSGTLLPLNTAEYGLDTTFMADGGLGAPELFVAGDVRANEQIGLTAIHTLFAREHNRLASHLRTNNPSWEDDQLYETARRIVGAEIQAITYNEFLPALLGSHAPRAEDYNYDPIVDATIATEFSTALFRVGHTMLSPNLMLAGDSGAPIGSLSLRESFFNPGVIQNDPDVINHVLMGLAHSQSQEIDAQLVDDVRNFLFTPNSGPGIDLASLNIQRGRDHGLPDYNTVRVAYLLDPVDSFDDITSDVSLQATLHSLYNTVDNIDVWVGALAEDHVPGASVGELVMAGLVDQFERLRDGDAFFFYGDAELHSYEIEEIMDLESLTFMDIMVWNTDLVGMPPSFFMAVPEPSALTAVLLGSVTALGVRRRRG